MAIPLSNEIRALLDGPNFAHLATLMPDGSPQSAPVWVGREGDRILICTGEGSLKAKNTRRDPRVALSLIDFHDPYNEAQLRGRVVERRPDSDYKYIAPISHKYTGKPFPFRSPEGTRRRDTPSSLLNIRSRGLSFCSSLSSPIRNDRNRTKRIFHASAGRKWKMGANALGSLTLETTCTASAGSVSTHFG